MALSHSSPIESECFSILQEYFSHNSFRANQLETIVHTINGNDSLVVMSTGSGKSLCYQIPPIYLNKTAIIISPLISLSQNQVNSLRNKNISAVSITQNTNDADRADAFSHNKFKVIYLTPEGIESKIEVLIKFNNKFGISCIGIDESHCVVEWGHDFRPSYQRLFRLRDNLPNIPILALTATATKDVQFEIIKNLKLRNDPQHKLLHICGTFNRINLTYFIHRKQSVISDLSRSEYYSSGSTIIYCSTRKECDKISNILCGNGINAAAYHAGLEWQRRAEIQSKWEQNSYQCIVATVAFGMGIDKGDIRHVIHYGIPKSIESYYQQTGRAGRDGMLSQCILYFNDADFVHCEWIINQSQTEKGRQIALKGVQKIKSFIYSSQCRINIILNHFGEVLDGGMCSDRCDNCIANGDGNGCGVERDFSVEAKKMIECVLEVGPHWTMNQIIGVCKGSDNSSTRKVWNLQRKKTFAALSNYTIGWLKGLGRNLVHKDVLCEIIASVETQNKSFKYKKIGVTDKARNILCGKVKLKAWVPDIDMLDNAIYSNKHIQKNEQKGGRPVRFEQARKKSAGKRWTEEDDNYIWQHRDDSKKVLAQYFDKTVGAIRARLKHLEDPEHSAYIRLFGGNNSNNSNNNGLQFNNTPNWNNNNNNNMMRYVTPNSDNNNKTNTGKRGFCQFASDNNSSPMKKRKLEFYDINTNEENEDKHQIQLSNPWVNNNNNSMIMNNNNIPMNQNSILQIVKCSNGASIHDLSQKLNISSNDPKLHNVLDQMTGTWQIYQKNDTYFLF